MLGNQALHLQQQVVFGRAADRPVQKCHFDAGTAELIDWQHLVGISPSQPVRRMHVDPVDLPPGHGVSQPLKCRASQRGSAVAFVDVAVIRANDRPIGRRALMQG